MNKSALLLSALLLAPPVDAHAAKADSHPGYGVVESIIRLRPEATPSASAGASAPGKAAPARYLVRVRLDDGSLQVREVRKLQVRKGERVLVTNAGDVVPD